MTMSIVFIALTALVAIGVITGIVIGLIAFFSSR